MGQVRKSNRLLPWYIGISLVIAAVLYLGYEAFYVGCEAPTMVELVVLIALPVIYLALMYLTLTSQE